MQKILEKIVGAGYEIVRKLSSLGSFFMPKNVEDNDATTKISRKQKMKMQDEIRRYKKKMIMLEKYQSSLVSFYLSIYLLIFLFVFLEEIFLLLLEQKFSKNVKVYKT